MSKATARLLIVAIGLVAGILACQLPGSTKPNVTATNSALPEPSPTTLGGVVAPTTDSNATDAVSANQPATQNATQFHTSQAQTQKAETATAKAAGVSYTSRARTQVAQTATAKAASAKNRPKSVVIQKGPAGALPHLLNLAFDTKGTLHLFGVAAAGKGTNIVHQQLGSDGNWTAPQPVATNFNVLSLAPQPDPSGFMCLLWGGQLTGGAKPLTGVFQSCPNGDGSWPAVTDPIARPLTSDGVRIVALASIPGGTAGALYISLVNGVPALFFSPIDLQATHAALAATPVSRAVPVLAAALAMNTRGGVYALWLDSTGGTAYSVEAADSSDKGKTWSVPHKLYSGIADNPTEVTIQLAADSAGIIHALWDGDRKIFYQRWTATGGWGDVVQLSGDDRWGQVERLAVTSDGFARAAWTAVAGSAAQVVYSAQAADGTWSPAQPVADDRAFDLALCVDGQGANHVVWTGQADMRYATWAP